MRAAPSPCTAHEFDLCFIEYLQPQALANEATTDKAIICPRPPVTLARTAEIMRRFCCCKDFCSKRMIYARISTVRLAVGRIYASYASPGLEAPREILTVTRQAPPVSPFAPIVRS